MKTTGELAARVRASSQANRNSPLARSAKARVGLALGFVMTLAAALASETLDTEEDIQLLDAGTPAPTLAAAGSVSGVPDQNPISLASELPEHDPSVGRLGGEAASSGGAATYRIPIVLPPGRRGMQPDLALVYSSRDGNGIAGMGWSISGLSSISRCARTVEQDGAVEGVSMDATDRLCLDGQRLVPTAGVYGQAGATYTTELASFARVTQLGGSLGSANTYFKVEEKSGDILFYGGASSAGSAARVVPGGQALPMSWLLERRQDRVGNMVRYGYTSVGNGESLLSYVVYTGFNGVDGNRRVSFSYGLRPTSAGSNDVSSSYQAGGLALQTRRLEQITTAVGSQPVRRYQLRYDAPSRHSGRSMLRGVQECAFADDGATACRRETTFTWQESSIRSSLHELQLAGLPSDKPFSSIRPYGDIDGDGVQELIVHYSDPTQATNGTDYLVSLGADRSVRSVVAASSLGGAFSAQPDFNHPVDINKDGRTDVAAWRTINGSQYLLVTLWNASASAWSASSFTTYNLPVPQGNLGKPLLGDVNGDGFADLIATSVAATSGSLSVYLGRPGEASGTPAFTASPAITRALPYATQANGARLYFRPERLTDFDGDGLADVVLSREPLGSPYTPTERDRAQLTWFSRSSAGDYTLGGPGNEINSFAATASPALEADETNLEAFTRTADVNGDGLEDLISIKVLDGAGYWSVRLNRGGRWGPRLVTASRRGIEICQPSSTLHSGTPFGWPTCADRWAPMFASLLSIADTDSDGRAEILAPRAFAMRVCNIQTDWIMRGRTGEPHDTYWCPEHPVTGQLGPTPSGFDAESDYFKGFYGNHGGVVTVDGSAYFMDAVRFAQSDADSMTAETIQTPIVKSGAVDTIDASAANEDMYGDGLEDYISPIGLPLPKDTDGRYPYYRPYVFVGGSTWGPAALPDGTSAASVQAAWRYFIAENMGAGPNPDGQTPQIPDTLAMVTDGMGVSTGWTYYPLSSSAGRAAGDLPLYSLPASVPARYVDDRHFYFTSSMPVVSDMFQSDGLGDVRSWRYGYGEAMYHARGRGFRGFRTIVAEDEAAGVRTTTTFSQKFPLTSQVEQVALSSMHRSYADPAGIFRLEKRAWRCNRASRADQAACAPPDGVAREVFPFLDTQEVWTYDAAVADRPSGTPALLSYQRQVVADDSSCAGATSQASGYDANGNVVASTVLTYDGNGGGDGDGTAGTREFVKVHCSRTRSVYAAADSGNWWLDKLVSRTVTSAILYNPNVHPLPAGVANPPQTVTTAYNWNADRTLQSEILQPGIANQEKRTTYNYPGNANYGMASGVTTEASGDDAGPRKVSTTYSADGYFAAVVVNPLGYTVKTIVRPADGQPAQATDPNGLRTLFQYDAFGFNTSTQFRGPTDGEYLAPDRRASLTWCGSGCFANGKYRQTVVQDGQPTTVVDSDMLGRQVGAGRRLADNTWSDVARLYDQAGRLVGESEPYRPGPDKKVFWTRYLGFDLLGRPLEKVVPRANQDGRGDMVTTYTYSGRTTLIRVCGTADAGTGGCLNAARTTDSLGRFVETDDAAPGTTDYWYDATGNVLAIRDANGNVLSARYNAIGQRLVSDDPNQGRWSFQYDALGELRQQTDSRGITTTMKYDPLGRMTERSAAFDYDGIGDPDTVVDSWTYDPTYAKGALAGNSRRVNGAVLRTEQIGYDTLARPVSRTIQQSRVANVEAERVIQQTAYDLYYGRPKAQSFGNAETLWLRYSRYGDLTRESSGTDGTDYRLVNAVDVRGRPSRETWAGGNLVVTRGYLDQTGQVSSIAYTSLGASVRAFDYAYDVFGDLGQQQLDGGATREVYTYDKLLRLTEATRTGQATGTVTYSYDAVGNLTSKSDFSIAAPGAYAYDSGDCGGGPNAVKSVTLLDNSQRTYCYDAAGNLTRDNAGLAARYDHTQRPLRIERSSAVDAFEYTPDGEKAMERGTTDGEIAFFGALERHYLPAAEDKLYAGSNTLITRRADGSRSVSYLLTDRLGSVDAVADAKGLLIEARGYDAFGKPRTGVWGDASPAHLPNKAITTHGFTDHEHLDSLQLIHMNGRVYDYGLGRFMAVDPVVQFPLNSQSLNPYSYILNNPLSGTDPTGFAACTGSHIDRSDGSSCDQQGVWTTYINAPEDHKKDKDSNGADESAKADQEAKNSPNKIGGPSSRIDHCATGPLTCHIVGIDPTKAPSDLGLISSNDIDGAAYGNGISGSLERHETLGSEHVPVEFDPGLKTFVLIDSPSVSGFVDAFRIFFTQLGFINSRVRQLAAILEDVQATGHNLSVVCHSGGCAELKAAIKFAYYKDHVSLTSIRASFHGGANNIWLTNRLLDRAGVERFGGINSLGYRYSPYDLVPQLVGGNGWMHPIDMIGALLYAPRLFGDESKSPHTLPYRPKDRLP